MVVGRAGIPASSFTDFATLLRVLRRRARLTQRELGIAVGYSEAQISRLEQGKRLPDPAVVAALFVPSLRLSGEPEVAARLHELARSARSARHQDESPSAREDDGPSRGERPSEDAGDDESPDENPGEGSADVGPATHPDDLAAIPAAPRPGVDRPVLAGRLRGGLADGQRVLLYGEPGTGKTTLAAAVARDLAPDIPVCWLTLTAGITTPAEAVVRRLARFLDRHGQRDVAPLLDPSRTERPLPRDEQLYLLGTALNRSGTLTCLDNAHLLDSEPDTRSLVEHLVSSTQVAFAAISREQLLLPGFEPFRVGGLDRAEATALIERLSGRALPGQLAGRLIARTDGNPMLIRLALGQVGTGDPAALVDRLETQSAVSAYLLRTTLAGLSEPGRLLTALLAVFRHPVDLHDERLIEAGQGLAGSYDAAAGIEELLRRQLVGDSARAALHPLVRDHVYAGLAGDGRHRRSLHRLAASHCDRALGDPLEASWHYTRAGDPAAAAGLLIAGAAALAARGRSVRAADLITELLAGDGVSDENQRQLLVVRGDLLLHTERAVEAEQSYRAALARPDPPAARADVSWRLAQSLLQRAQAPEALELCRTATAGLADQDVVLRGQLAAVRAQALLTLSRFDEAAASAAAACELADQIATVAADVAASVRARSYGVLGIVARLRGRADEAREQLGLALAAARTAGLSALAGRTLFNSAAIAHENGELDQAERLYGQALAEMRTVGDAYGTASVLHAQGALRHGSGATDEAMALLLEACALRRRLGDPHGTANSEHAYARVLLSVGQIGEARAMLAEVIAATASIGERRSRGYYLDSMAMFALADEDLSAAGGYLDEAADLAAAIGDANLLTEIGLHRVLAKLASGDLAGATDLTAAGDLAGAGQAGGAGLVGGRAGASASKPLVLMGLALAACLALAAADGDSAATYAARMARLAASTGHTLEGWAAERIGAAAAAVRRGGPAPPPTRYPRLIMVAEDDQLAAGPLVTSAPVSRLRTGPGPRSNRG
jgi:ATP/maltotriose-dependent transcriptional regulator MalT/transcriptional regulator with XRE-family HTH domain